MITRRELDVLLIEVETWKGLSALNATHSLSSDDLRDVIERLQTDIADLEEQNEDLRKEISALEETLPADEYETLLTLAWSKTVSLRDFMREFMGQFSGSHDDAIHIDDKIKEIVAILEKPF